MGENIFDKDMVNSINIGFLMKLKYRLFGTKVRAFDISNGVLTTATGYMLNGSVFITEIKQKEFDENPDMKDRLVMIMKKHYAVGSIDLETVNGWEKKTKNNTHHEKRR